MYFYPRIHPQKSIYTDFETRVNANQLCAGLPSKTNYTTPFSGLYEEDFGGPLICLDKTTKAPIFTGVSSSNSLSTKRGQPGKILSYYISEFLIVDQGCPDRTENPDRTDK